MTKAKTKQLKFFKNKSIYASWKQLGGAKLKSHPKRKRPISTKHEIHLVMKSGIATGALSMRAPSNSSYVKTCVFNTAKRMKIRIARFENVGNHLHLLLKTPSHAAYVAFVRGVSSTIARHILTLSKSSPFAGEKTSEQTTGFWEARPFTRIVTWGRDRLALLKYLNCNRIQAIGFRIFVEEQTLGYLLTG